MSDNNLVSPLYQRLCYPKYLKDAAARLSIINFIPIGLSRGFQVLTTCHGASNEIARRTNSHLFLNMHKYMRSRTNKKK